MRHPPCRADTRRLRSNSQQGCIFMYGVNCCEEIHFFDIHTGHNFKHSKARLNIVAYLNLAIVK